MSKSPKKDAVERETFAAIERGDFKECYLIYNRKSSDEADSQKNSIEFQNAESMRFAARESLPVAGITITGLCNNGSISERHSGFKEDENFVISSDGKVTYQIDRPKFQRLLQLVNQGYIKGVICLCWDRISRNKSDDAIVRKLMKKGVDIRFVHAHYDDSSAGELHMDIDGMFAQHHSRVTSEKVRLSKVNSRSQGKCTYRAPIGYLNEGNMDWKPFDPERAPMVKEMFELYATGDWSLSDLTRHARKIGLTAPPMRRRRTKEEMLADEEVRLEKVTSPIQQGYMAQILKNKFYIGYIIGNNGKAGEWVKSESHEPLVDEKLFNKVQALLGKKNVSTHYTEKLDYPLRGIMRCSCCGRIYTPYVKKGNQYYYSRCKDGCTNKMKNLHYTYVVEKVRKLVSGLHFTDDELEEFESRAGTDIALLENKRDREMEVIERKKKKVRDELAYLRSERVQLLKTGVFTPEGYVEETNRLEGEIDDLQTEEQVSEEAMRELMKEVVHLSELLKNVVPIYDYANPQEKEKIIRAIFSELSFSHDTLQYKVKKGFETFDKRISAFCGPTWTRTTAAGFGDQNSTTKL